MSDIDTELLPDFLTGTREHLDEIEAMLIKLGDDLESEVIIHDLFKPIHTIKGSAQFIGLERIALLAHHMEDLLDMLRQHKLQIAAPILDVLMDGRDRIVALVYDLEQTQQEVSLVADLINKLEAMMVDSNAQSNLDAQASDEEADQELFQVFIDNLQQRICEIKARATQCKSDDDPAAQLVACSTALDNLISSANYMGYEALVADLRTWKTENDTAAAQLQSGDLVSFEFMDTRVDWIIGVYPQVAAAVILADDATRPAVDDVDDTTAAVMAAFAEDGDNVELIPEVVAKDELSSAGLNTEQDAEQNADEIDIEYELLGDFITEANEHLEEIETLLLSLGDDFNNIDILNEVFRPIHTIKGGAQFIGLARIAKLSHRMEDLLDLMRRGERNSSTEIIDTLIDGRDRIAVLTRELETNQREESEVNDLVNRLTIVIDGGDTPTILTKAAENIEDDAPIVAAPISAATSAAGSINFGGQDSYQEESDQELFGIFIDQMREKLASIAARITDLPVVSEPITILTQCGQEIAELKSSANYMGYEHLNLFYLGWLQAIDHVESELNAGRQASFDFMADHLSELASRFPQTQADSFVLSTSRDDVVAIDNESAEEQALFNKLSSALDQAMTPTPAAEHVETLQDVFEEMLSGKTVDTRDALQAVKQDVLSSQNNADDAAMQAKIEPDLPERRDDDRRGDVEERRNEERRTGERVYKKSIRVDADKIDALMNQVGELVVDRSFFFQLFNEMKDLQTYLKESAGLDQREIKQVRAFTYRLGEAIAGFGRTTNELQEGVMKVRMLPISQLFNRYPRLLRDLTHNTDKKVRLEVSGEETELDKMVVEELADPLIHIIRNAVDHGLETPQQRKKSGKGETGTLMLEAYQEGNHIVIDVGDDGRGIDPAKVKAKALANGMHTQEQLDEMTQDEVINLIMDAGFSTAEKITGTSGRGVGMDVVKTNVDKLNGTLEIESDLGVGTRMRLKIPLTLAIIPALMIRVGKSMFTIPLANVEETLHIRLADTTTIEGTEVIHLRGQTLPIFHLSKLFNIESTAEVDGTAFVVVVNTGGQQIGFSVDELMGQEEVVIKPLVDYLQERSGFSGATIIGDGRISLILDIYALVKITSERQASRQQQLATKRRALSQINTVEPGAQL